MRTRRWWAEYGETEAMLFWLWCIACGAGCGYAALAYGSAIPPWVIALVGVVGGAMLAGIKREILG